MLVDHKVLEHKSFVLLHLGRITAHKFNSVHLWLLFEKEFLVE